MLESFVFLFYSDYGNSLCHCFFCNVSRETFVIFSYFSLSDSAFPLLPFVTFVIIKIQSQNILFKGLR